MACLVGQDPDVPQPISVEAVDSAGVGPKSYVVRGRCNAGVLCVHVRV